MASNVETMFYVRQKPWHGLGTEIKNAPTSEDALVYAGLDWTVLQKNVYSEDGNLIPGCKANIRNTDKASLGIVSDKYKVIQNTQAFAFTDALIGENCQYETAGSINNFRTTWLLARLEPKKIMGDEYNNFLCFMNSFDGSTAVKVCVTPIRVVCQNTLNLALARAKRTFSMKHIGDMSKKFKEAEQVLNLSSEYLVNVEKTYEELARKRISTIQFDSFLKQLFPIAEDEKNTRKETTAVMNRNAVRKCYEVDDLDNFKGTAFGVVNAVSDMISHSKPMRMTDSYYGNLFGKVMEGHPTLDRAVELVKVLA